jgi:hypothetical protein
MDLLTRFLPLLVGVPLVVDYFRQKVRSKFVSSGFIYPEDRYLVGTTKMADSGSIFTVRIFSI